MLNKVIAEEYIECAFPNVEISLRIFFNINGHKLHYSMLILSNEAYKKSKLNNDETREVGIHISAHDWSRFVAPN